MKFSSARKKLSWFLVGVILSVIIYRTLLTMFHLSSETYIYNSLESRVDAIALGALLALNIDLKFFEKFKNNFKLFKVPKLIITILLIALMGTIPIAIRDTIGFSVHAFLFCLLIIQLLQWDNSNSPSSTPGLFNAKSLGSISYWFYLLHPWGISLGEHLKLTRNLQVSIGGLIFLTAILVSYFSLKKLEQVFTQQAYQIRAYQFIQYQLLSFLRIG